MAMPVLNLTVRLRWWAVVLIECIRLAATLRRLSPAQFRGVTRFIAKHGARCEVMR